VLGEDGQPMVDEMGNEVSQKVARKERFIPDFDIDVEVVSKRPNDREYFTNSAFQLANMGIAGPEDVLYTLEEGKLPEREDILEGMKARNQVQALTAQLQELPPEAQEMVMQGMGQLVQGALRGVENANMQLGGGQDAGDSRM